jgi:hypothetical protein
MDLKLHPVSRLGATPRAESGAVANKLDRRNEMLLLHLAELYLLDGILPLDHDEPPAGLSPPGRPSEDNAGKVP